MHAKHLIRTGRDLVLVLTALLAWPGAAAETGMSATPFPPAQATVLLVAGLPGDVESENVYRDQMQGWFDLLAAAPQKPARVVAFFDTPATLLPPKDLPVEVRKASREEILGVAGSLAGSKHPLVVVLWGHGGMQGGTPVFHVRGPRVSAADLKTLVEQSSATASCWVLTFRGSGKFAGDLAATGREVFSSEGETMFASDPVAMEVWLKTLRNHPGLPFAEAAALVGPAVKSWYEERSLARTEEPLLWPGSEPVRKLAGDSAVTPPITAATAERPVAGSNPPPASGDSPKAAVAVTTNTSTDLPSVWRELPKVDPRAYPEADAVTVRQRMTYTLGSSPAIAVDHEEFTQILTAAGKRHGDFDLSFSSGEDVTFKDCEVLRADGKLVRLDPDEIREGRDPSLGDYPQSRRKFFSLPGVGPGAVLHVRYRSEWKKFPLPHVSLDIPLGSATPALDVQLQVSLPKDTAFHYEWTRDPGVEPEFKQAAYGTTYSWRFAKLAAEPEEALSPPGWRQRLRVSTFPDWAAFADWYGRVCRLTDELTPELRAKAEELTREARSERDKVLAVYHYVAGLRYVAVPLGINSHRPHAAANVLRNQFGDCKDKANLFNTLLHALGIEAHLVLVPRFSQASDAVPGMGFNHAISRFRLGGEVVWADTTEDVCRFGLLPPGDPGRSVLVIDGKSTSLTRLPQPEAREHRLKMASDLRVAGGGEITSRLEATASGSVDYFLRLAVRQREGHHGAGPLLATRLRPTSGQFALTREECTEADALDREFDWKAEGTWLGLRAESEGRRLLRAPFWLPRDWELALHHRSLPLFLEQGYPLGLEEQCHFRLPEGAQLAPLPPVCGDVNGPLRWHFEWTHGNTNSLTAKLQVELAHGELNAAESAKFQSQLRDLLNACATPAGYSSPPSADTGREADPK